MNWIGTPEDFYSVGGTMSADAPSYVERKADQELLAHVIKGDFCYILRSRQMGKSSLMTRTVAQLQEKHICSVVIDLSEMIQRGMTAEEFYSGLVNVFIQELKLPTQLGEWWQTHALLSAVQRFSDFVSNEVLSHVQHRVVVFIDEIDSTLNLDFSDDFFAALRAFYNHRARHPDLHRLTFVLLGVASPTDLIQDRTRTPFNIGYRIELKDFTFDEARKLAGGLPMDDTMAEQALARVLYWTAGHPYLTQKMCAALVTARQPKGRKQRVDTLVHTLFFSERAWEDPNLVYVRDRILEDKNHADALLELYRRVLSREPVLDDDRSLVYASLKLAGIVKVSLRGVLEPRNRIYQQVFDLAWVSTVWRTQLRSQTTEELALEAWKGRVYERFWGWRQRMQQAGTDSVYVFLSTVTLWPVIEAVRAGEWALVAALEQVLSKVDGKLLMNHIQGWKDEADGMQKLAVEVALKPTLRAELDVVLDILETFPRAMQTLSQEDRTWFTQTLQTELEHLGNIAHFAAYLPRENAIAQRVKGRASIQLLRIIVASPGDVQAERDALPGVLDELNRGIAAAHGLWLELGRWETDTYPGFHPQGPQGLIDPLLRIEDCDVLLGIFWKRFGTPTTEAGPGTEHEFLRAFAAWQQHGRPQIMIYFNQQAATPKTKAETDQWGQVLDFQQRFPKEGLWWPYQGKAQFARLVRNHLTQFLR